MIDAALEIDSSDRVFSKPAAQDHWRWHGLSYPRCAVWHVLKCQLWSPWQNDCASRAGHGGSADAGGYYDPELGAFVGGPAPPATGVPDGSSGDVEPMKLNLELPDLPDVFGKLLAKKEAKPAATLPDDSVTEIVPKDEQPPAPANDPLDQEDSWAGDWVDAQPSKPPPKPRTGKKSRQPMRKAKDLPAGQAAAESEVSVMDAANDAALDEGIKPANGDSRDQDESATPLEGSLAANDEAGVAAATDQAIGEAPGQSEGGDGVEEQAANVLTPGDGGNGAGKAVERAVTPPIVREIREQANPDAVWQ